MVMLLLILFWLSITGKYNCSLLMENLIVIVDVVGDSYPAVAVVTLLSLLLLQLRGAAVVLLQNS